jgi:hypothetical protein
MTFEATNLDAMEPADLREWADKLPDTLPSRLHTLLAGYARRKADAMDARLDGRIKWALNLEAQCEQIYFFLPPECRW